MMRRPILVLAAVSGVALTTACASSPEKVAGEAAPIGATSSAAASTSSAASTSTSPGTPKPGAPKPGAPKPGAPKSGKPQSGTPKTEAPKNTVLVLGPTSLGKLKIGMLPKAATATGEIDAPVPAQGCGSAALKPANSDDVKVTYSADRGLVAIPAYGRIATPEGIRIGSSVAQLKAAYPDLVRRITEEGQPAEIGDRESGDAFAGKGDEYKGVHYRFQFLNGKLTELELEHDNQNCYE
jgi:hypothetical protein